MNKVMKEFLNTAIYLLCVLGAVWLVITFVGQRTEVGSLYGEYSSQWR